MTVGITPAHNAARLAATLTYIDTGAAAARLQIRDGSRPVSADDAAAGTLLAEITLTQPAGSVAAGVLTLTQAENGLIVATGTATWARLLNGDGDPVADMDCSDTAGAGDVQLAQVSLLLGGDVRLVSAALT